jgi:hypothetical protein
MPAIDNGQYLILVNSNDIVYTNSPSAQQLFKYDYSAPIPTFSPITIAGFPNTSIFHWGTPKETCRNVSDNILAINLNENKIYSVNTVTSQVKNIEYSSSPPLQGLEFPEYDYVYDGNFIYLTGNIEGQPSSGNLLIGNPPVQSIYYYPTQTTILTKLSLDDFSFRVQSGGEDVLTKTSKSTNFVERPDGIRIFPNPSTTQLTISSSTTTISRVTIYNIYGSKVTERTFNNSNIVALTLAELNQGVYTCRMLTSGGIVNKKIVVLR